MNILKTKAFVLITSVLVLTISAFADVLVYDGMPTSGTDSYSTGKLEDQNATESSIIGETGKWFGRTTGVLLVSDPGLSNPTYVTWSDQTGGVEIYHTASSTATPRTLGRALSTPVSNRSFYFSVLMSYDDLSSYSTGDRAEWGLTQTSTTTETYPPNDGIVVGFEKTSTGVNAILRVNSTIYTIEENITADTYHFVGYFDFNYSGDDTVYASINPGASEPSTWDVSATADVLSLDDSLSYVNVGAGYWLNSNSVNIDEWYVGENYADLIGSGDAPPVVFTTAATNVTSASAWLNGYITSTGTASTVVSVYYGNSDEGSDTGAWDTSYTFPNAVVDEPQYFTFEDTTFTAGVHRYYRFAASNSAGFVWAPTVEDFLPQSAALPAITNIAIGTVDLTTAELTADVTATSPKTSVYVCYDTSDMGTVSTSNWSNIEYVGAYLQPTDISDTISGLTANGTYYARFYAVNSIGDAWTQVATFTNSSPTVSITDEYIDEGDTGTSPINLQISLNMPSAIDTVIYYQTSDDTAIANINYIPADTSLTIPAGVTSTNVTIQAINNTKDEFPGVGFWVTITSADDLIIDISTAEAGILDNDMGKVLFADNFSDGNDDGWTKVVSPTKWSVVNQTYKYSQNSSAGETITGESQWSDYGLRVMMRTADDWKRMGLVAYSQGGTQSSEKYQFSFQRTTGTQSYSPKLEAGGTTLASISGNAGGRVGISVFRPAAIRLNNTPAGVRIRCYIGFTKIFDYVDTDNTYTSGMIGLYAGTWCNAYYDDVKVFSEASGGTVLIIQ